MFFINIIITLRSNTVYLAFIKKGQYQMTILSLGALRA
jgi:hypothetical protein